jgi:hypothetical protein
MAARKSNLFLRNITILLGLATMALGCGPASIAYLFMPFVDDRIEPRCKLAKKDKEVKIVIASRFENLEVRPDLRPADQELAEALAMELRKRFATNKEKAKVELPVKVRSHLAKLKDWNATSLRQVGENLQADYVIELNIQNLSLKVPVELYHGKADVEVTVYDIHREPLDSVIHKETFRCVYPATGPIDASRSSPDQFRALFNARMARDVARWFTAYTSEQKFDID